MIVVAATSDSDESIEAGKDQVRQMVEDEFGEEQALQKIKDYQMDNNDLLSQYDLQEGSTIEEYYEARGSVPVIENMGWVTEEGDEAGAYRVGFNAKLNNMENMPRWILTSDSIRTVNGAANTITPELELKPAEDNSNDTQEEPVEDNTTTQNQKEIYAFTKKIYRKYEQEVFDKMDADPEGDYSEEAVQADERALQETMEKYGISIEELIDIISKGDSEGWEY
jgi:hypothetical protein